jgi:transposase
MTYSFDLKIRMVNYYNITNKSLREISKDFDITKSSLHRWINNKCIIKTERKTEYKIRTNILGFLKRSLNHNPFQNLDMLKNKIFTKYDLEVSKSTVSNYLKIIGYSKKKITRRLYGKSLKEQTLNRKNMKKKLKKINKDDIICVDESGIHRELYAKHGWCKKNKKLLVHIKNNELPKNHSLIMAISNKEVLKYELHKQQAINTKIYYSFLKDLLTNVKNKYILMDNVSFHKSNSIKDLISNTDNKILFIPPYSPDFNPIEEVFAEMKAYIRKYVNPLTLNKDIHTLLKKFSKNIRNIEGYYRHAFD